jgi:hypothetical protein
MLFQNLRQKKPSREFRFTPYYYEVKEPGEAEDGPRIRFRRIRSRAPVQQKSIRGFVVLALFIIFFLAYYWQAGLSSLRTYKLEDIRIEEIPGAK